MEAIIDFSQAPFGYPVCMNRECIQASTCLRQLIERTVPADVQQFTIVNPKYLASQEGSCPYYRPANKVYFTKGFIDMLESLPYKQMRAISSGLLNLFGRRTYFRVRKGERLLSPEEQQRVLY
ncbi:MAG: DUF6078 family protein [Tannerellaceae bacterium]|nr:DUF6078 family protein [Tannerellaceae bacterium]